MDIEHLCCPGNIQNNFFRTAIIILNKKGFSNKTKQGARQLDVITARR